MTTDDIVARQLRSENRLFVNESLVKIGTLVFMVAFFFTSKLVAPSELSFLRWSLSEIIIYIGLLYFAGRSSKRCRAFSDAAEIMLQFDNEEARRTYFDEKLRNQL
jgi:hypothetical protein